MAIRKLNFTGRIRIKRKHAVIRLLTGDTSRFEVNPSLDHYNLRSEYLVFVEAYRQTMLERFAFGTVGTFRPPSPEDMTLEAFDTPEKVLFRLQVTDPASGCIVAYADRIKPTGEDSQAQTSLINVVPVDLGNNCWQVNFEDAPIFQINKNIPDWRTAITSPEFRALVYPAALREILERILRVERHTDTEDQDDWRSLWLRFATTTLRSGHPPGIGEDDEESDDGIDDWIGEAVNSFCRRLKPIDLARQFMGEHGR